METPDEFYHINELISELEKYRKPLLKAEHSGNWKEVYQIRANIREILSNPALINIIP